MEMWKKGLIGLASAGAVFGIVIAVTHSPADAVIEKEKRKLSCEKSKNTILEIVRFSKPISNEEMLEMTKYRQKDGFLNEHEAMVTREIIKHSDAWVSIPVFNLNYKQKEDAAWAIGHVACMYKS